MVGLREISITVRHCFHFTDCRQWYINNVQYLVIADKTVDKQTSWKVNFDSLLTNDYIVLLCIGYRGYSILSLQCKKQYCDSCIEITCTCIIWPTIIYIVHGYYYNHRNPHVSVCTYSQLIGKLFTKQVHHVNLFYSDKRSIYTLCQCTVAVSRVS